MLVDLVMTLSKKAFWKFFKFTLPFLILAGLSSLFFWKVLVKNQVPIPADFVVGVYYPWLDYKWGFAAGVPVKNPITTDVVSFTYPMQMLAVDLIKSGQWPLWNPYILGGTPLLANFQSAPFSPTNFVYFAFDKLTGWSIQIILQHVLAALFTYLLLRRWKVSKLGSILGGAIYAFSGYNLIWSQWNGHTLSAAFIPLILLCQDLWLEKGKVYWGLGVSVALFFQIISGYPQVVIYTAASMLLLWVIRFSRKRQFFLRTAILGFFLVLGMGLSAFQILPGIELLGLSQRAVEPHPFEWAFLPFSKAITVIAPDFFGNHATKNYWGPQDYTSNTGFVGVVAFTLGVFALCLIKIKKEVMFAAALAAVALVFSFASPISIYLWKSGLLGLNAASAHRALILFNLGVGLLAGFGLDKLIASKKAIIWPLILFAYGVWAAAFYFLSRGNAQVYEPLIRGIPKYVVALRNLVLPTAAFIITLFVFSVLPRLKGPIKNILVILYFLVGIFELFRFGWKFTPFSPRSIVYPKTPVIDYLQSLEAPVRTTGSTVIPINMRMPYEIESLEGYDAIYPLRISKLIAAVNSGKTGTDPVGRYGTVDNSISQVLSLLNTKYHLAIKENVRGDPDPEGALPKKFMDKKFERVFEDKTVAILEDKEALPRAKMFYQIKVMTDETKALGEILKEDFLDSNKVVFDKDPQIELTDGEEGKSRVSYKLYKETESVIEVETSKSGFLFISDSYYPGWEAYVDASRVELFRANYAFRAVFVPQGKHAIRLSYKPQSFFRGVKITAASAGIILVLLFVGFLAKGRKGFIL